MLCSIVSHSFSSRGGPLRAFAAVCVLAAASNSFAYLGSFAPADGYALPYGDVSKDVTYYNAGQYGPNAGGGGGPTGIIQDTGLWSLVSPVGGYFSNVADRAAYTSGGPPYGVSGTNALGAYLIGAHFSGRNLDGYNLAMRNDTPVGTGPAVYDYSLDSFDFGGVAPANVTSGPVDLQFYFCPNPGDTPQPGGRPSDKFTLSLRDSSGNVGLQWGYLRDNSVVWRTSSSNPWNTTAFIADQSDWDGVKIGLDLTTATFSIDYFDKSALTWTNIVPAGTGMGMAMGDLTVLRWQLEDGLSAGVGGKNFFDDFSTTVPEPSSVVLVALLFAGIGATRRSA